MCYLYYIADRHGFCNISKRLVFSIAEGINFFKGSARYFAAVHLLIDGLIDSAVLGKDGLIITEGEVLLFLFVINLEYSDFHQHFSLLAFFIR